MPLRTYVKPETFIKLKCKTTCWQLFANVGGWANCCMPAALPDGIRIYLLQRNKIMNIAFDAKRAFVNDTGLGNYSRTLITSLAHDFPQHQYFLCTPKTGPLFKPAGANLQVMLPEKPLHKLMPAAWRSKWVVGDLVRHGIELYHGLSHEIPQGIAQTEIRSVVTMHDLIHERYPDQYPWLDRKIYSSKFKYACHHADAVIAISEQTKRDLIDFYNTDPSKIHVCYQSCHPMYSVQADIAQKAAISKKYSLPDQYLLYVGSIIERKNLLNVCKALQLAKDVTMPLVVIGKGKAYKRQVEQYLASHQLSNRVIFLSYQKQANGQTGVEAADFPAIYQMSRMLIYPSFFEGFGIPVIEGLYSGIPVITSNTSCLPEAGGDAAFYVDPSSAEEIAAQIRNILGNTAIVEQQVKKGILHAQRFSNEIAAAAVHKVYEGLF